MKFGIHNTSWLFGSDPYDVFGELKRKAQWCETHGFTWFSVMDHLIQIPSVGAPEEPFLAEREHSSWREHGNVYASKSEQPDK